MNDTVTKLLYLADDFAAAAHNYFVNTNSKPKWEKMVSERQALQDELTRLFTPLTDEQIGSIYRKFGGDMINCARSIERQHGITGERNEPN